MPWSFDFDIWDYGLIAEPVHHDPLQPYLEDIFLSLARGNKDGVHALIQHGVGQSHSVRWRLRAIADRCDQEILVHDKKK